MMVSDRRENALIQTILSIEWFFKEENRQKCDGYTTAIRKGGEYSYIPLFLPEFMNCMDTVKRLFPSHKMFLDVGCGFATKVKIAQGFGFQATGIEMDEFLVQKSREILFSFSNFGTPEDIEKEARQKIVHVNAFDFRGYGEFDVIYYYCPIADNKKESELEALIESKMRVGAVLVPVMKKNYGYQKSKNFKEVSRYPLIIQKVRYE